MRFGVTLPNCGVGPDPNTVVDLAVDAEQAGWEGVFVWDFPIGGPELQDVHEAWTLLAAIAVRTERVLLGTMITPLAWRTPWYVAKQAATMQALSGGRFVLSVGLGAPPPDGTQFYEEEDRRVRARMLEEGLAIVRQLWTGEDLEWSGEFYRTRNSPCILPVPDPRPEVWVVGAWHSDSNAWPRKKSLRRALEWDGVLPNIFDADGPNFDSDTANLKAMTEWIRSERAEPIDIICEGGGEKTDDNADADTVRGYSEAGATWWLEAVWWSMYRHLGDPEPMRKRIKQGPPKL